VPDQAVGRADPKAGVVRLEPGSTKNDDGRSFPFAVLSELEQTLRAQRDHTTALERQQGRSIPYVFHRGGEPILNFRNAWDGACKRAWLGGRIPHDFRRTAVRNLERAGVPRSVAMKLTGHKTESVYRRYAIVSEADLSAGAPSSRHCTRGTLARPDAWCPPRPQLLP
jgi:integrase